MLAAFSFSFLFVYFLFCRTVTQLCHTVYNKLMPRCVDCAAVASRVRAKVCNEMRNERTSKITKNISRPSYNYSLPVVCLGLCLYLCISLHLCISVPCSCASATASPSVLMSACLLPATSVSVCWCDCVTISNRFNRQFKMKSIHGRAVAPRMQWVGKQNCMVDFRSSDTC